jgi:hypothetical protein
MPTAKSDVFAFGRLLFEMMKDKLDVWDYDYGKVIQVYEVSAGRCCCCLLHLERNVMSRHVKLDTI